MGELRVERFSSPVYLAHVGEGEKVPSHGWAIRFDGDVFYDGVHVGRSGKYVFSRASGNPYGEISFEELDDAGPRR